MTKKDQTTLQVSAREILGRKVSQLRNSGMIPANITGMHQDSRAIAVTSRDFTQHLEKEGESGLLYLHIDDEKTPSPVLIDEIQYAPVLGNVLHVVFRRVNLREKVTADVPVETTGEFELKNANLVVVTDTLEVEALPADLPESFVLDVSKLTEIGQALTVNDLEYDREKITILMTEEERENPLVMAQEQRAEEEEIPEAEVTEATEGAETEKVDESEEKAE